MIRNRKRARGSAVIEVAMMMPLIAFLFIGALDMGFYTFALISIEDAARVAALYTSTSTSTAADATGACTYVIGEIKTLPNIGNTVTTCSTSPLVVTAQSVTGAASTTASLVSVTYTSALLIPIPGLLAEQFTWTRTVKMACRS